MSVVRGDARALPLPDASVDAIVCDPPYGLEFMGKEWDHGVPGIAFWLEALRVAKPGAHLLAFGGTRTFHRLACAIEDAGWEIRDCLMWVYGSGFPKSLDVSKAIDKAAGAEREVVGRRTGRAATPVSDIRGGRLHAGGSIPGSFDASAVTAPATAAAHQWQGWGTALKPAYEPVMLARKPLVGTVAENVQRYGTGAINVDGCRVAGIKGVPSSLSSAGNLGWRTGGDMERKAVQSGRWPANLIHDGSDDVLALFPQSTSGANPTRRGGLGFHGASGQEDCEAPRGAESGSAARFFYCAKASKSERGDGNTHPTVKPLALMRYLCRLVTPPGGLVLDPFCGSGSTLVAAHAEGFRAIGFDLSEEYCHLARRRIAAVPLALGL